MTEQRKAAEATIDADGEYAELTCGPGSLVAVSISGTWTGTVRLQRRLDGTNWRTVASWTGSIEATYQADTGTALRLGFGTGGFGTGSAVVRLQVG